MLSSGSRISPVNQQKHRHDEDDLQSSLLFDDTLINEYYMSSSSSAVGVEEGLGDAGTSSSSSVDYFAPNYGNLTNGPGDYNYNLSHYGQLIDGVSDRSESEELCTGWECYTHEEILGQIRDYIYPSTVEWFLITAHLIVFIVGLVGNALVCVAVYRNTTMRTVTNYFIVNLAVADFFVILLCLPPTVVWDVTETWFFGDALCKIIVYLQTVSVAVSVLTLTGISVERWYAICYPLKFKATTTRARKVILIIWVIALTFDAPELFFLHTVSTVEKRGINITTVYFTQCEPSWSPEYELVLVLARVFILYLIPLAFMSLAYYKIVRVLWSSANFPGRCDTGTTMSNVNSNSHGGRGSAGGGSNHHHTFNGSNNVHYNTQLLRPMLRGQSSQGAAVDYQLKSRRKAAKMLVAVVSVFAFCYLPVHIFNLTVMSTSLAQSELIGAIAMICHWLPYANSAINPVIYNFMSGKFRREFARAFECLRCKHAYIPTASRVYSFNHNAHHEIHRV